MKRHVQVLLAKARIHQVAWIPRKYAVVGKALKLKTPDKDWDDGWIVMAAARRNAQPSELIQKRAGDFKKMRKRTDI